MAATTPVPVNSALIAWARRESGYSVEAVARRVGVKPARLEAWEAGERQPTARQVGLLARALHRPLSVFYLPRPPRVPELARQYRRLPGVAPGEESPELRLALRRMLARREDWLNLAGELGREAADFRLRAHLREEPRAVGTRLRTALGVDSDMQRGWPNAWRAWAGWREAAEQAGALVFVFGGVGLEEARGLALPQAVRPVAAVNSKEGPESKSYTMLHELVHLMLAAAREEAPAMEEKRSAPEWSRVERFAEVAASHALVEEDALRAAAGATGRVAHWDVQGVQRLARGFRVSPLAMATRLRESGFMNWEGYGRWRKQWEAHVAALPPRAGGFATPAEKAVSRGGRSFAQLVLEALAADRITSLDAARYLDLRFEHFGELREVLAQSGGEGTGA